MSPISAHPLAPCHFPPHRRFCDPETSAYLPHHFPAPKAKESCQHSPRATQTRKGAGFLPESCFPVTSSSHNNNISSCPKWTSSPGANLSLCTPLVLYVEHLLKSPSLPTPHGLYRDYAYFIHRGSTNSGPAGPVCPATCFCKQFYWSPAVPICVRII